MQTWLPIHVPGDPIATYVESARVLDNARLGAQANEALVILRQCDGVPIPWTGRGWRNMTLTRAWRPYARHLALYGYAICLEQRRRGHHSPHLALFEVMSRAIRDTGAPHWLGGGIHAGSRANLLAKNPQHYGQFGWTETPCVHRMWDTIADAIDRRAAA